MRLVAPRECRLATPAGDIVWHEWGRRGAGPSLLLIHATGFQGRIWDQVVAHLPEGLHVIAPDQRGHGKSFKPAMISDWPSEAEDVAAVLEATTAGPAIVVGHSKGAVVATFAAALRPDLFNRLILVDPVALPDDDYWQGSTLPVIDPSAHPVSRRRNQWDNAEQMEAHFSTRPPYDQWDREVLADYCRYGLAPADNGSGWQLACPPHLEASVYLGSTHANPAQACGNVTCPVTILRGRSGERKSVMDFSISPTRPDLASLFPNARDMVWSEHSHFIPMEAPARLAALISQHCAEAGL